MDLSFYDVRTLEALPANARRNALTAPPEPGNVKTLSDGLATYITNVLTFIPGNGEFSQDIIDDEALRKVFSHDYLKLLHERSYEAEDLVIWSWIVTSKSADQAAKRLFAISTKLSNDGRTPVPLFIFLLVLRSRNVSAAGLKFLMNVLWTVTPCLGIDHQPSFRQILVSEQSAIILTVRLIRHARKVWPEAFGEIVSLMTQLIGHVGRDTLPIKSERAQRLCHVYNRILTLLSTSNVSPSISRSGHSTASTVPPPAGNESIQPETSCDPGGIPSSG